MQVVDQHSSPEAKIALFRSLFRGRQDVYPRRFENRRTGKSGYQPACAHEWVRDVCDKRAVRCTECPNRRFYPVTDAAVRCHLSGLDEAGRDFVMGVYPMLPDETCFFLAVDFDQKNWQEDAQAFLETCRRMALPASLERSRSGNGGHIWLFFEEAVPAGLVRRLASLVLTETMECRPDVGFRSYDRFFPNQDTLPKGGLGNLIALPLQKLARERGHTLFLDEYFHPYTDQWAYLAAVSRIGRAQAEKRVSEAEAKGNVMGLRLPIGDEEGDESLWVKRLLRHRKEPPFVGTLPDRVELILGNQIYIPKEGLPPVLCNRIIRLAAFQNPEFYHLQAMRLPTYEKPRVIACARDYPDHLELPRGCLEELIRLLSDWKIPLVISDRRSLGRPLSVSFQGELRHDQKSAAEALLAHDTGILSAATAFGKTVLAAWLLAQRGVSALVLVHRRQLMEQWVQRLSVFLGLTSKDIGRIGGGQKKPTGLLDVALMQSLVRKGVVDERVGEYGHLVVDECHHLSAFSFEQVARQAQAKFITGLSATVTRKDGHHPILFMQCGPVRYRVNAKAQTRIHPFHHNVYVRPTDFQLVKSSDQDMRKQFHELYEALIVDDRRNRRICEDVVRAVQEGRSPVVLTQRTEHLDRLAEILAPDVRHVIVLRGGMPRKEIQALWGRLSQIPENEERVLLSTGPFLGEGFDDARLDTLFLTLPVSWRGTIAQYAGRLHRLYHGKREVRIYDYADLNVPMAGRMFDRRCRGYEAIGYSILLPAGAVPGWPAEVSLPTDPNWKKDYSASVGRLIRDGIDVPLAKLFVQAAPISMEADGSNRARSAVEAFLFHRLRSLPATSGKFRLNVILPIPFDPWGQMEVDLLCTEKRIAIELDGRQHLEDLDAYRRDRQKDYLLQENGWLVLRFLAEDVGKRLDTVLDVILRAMAGPDRHSQ